MSSTGRTRVIMSKEDNRDGRVRNLTVAQRRSKSRARQAFVACEELEGRVVLTISGVSTSLLGSLSYVGVVTSPVITASVPILPVLPPIEPGPVMNQPYVARVTSTWTQLRSDLQALRLELQSLAQKSGATIADLQNLTTDSQAIAGAGFHFGVRSLNRVITELAMAVAGGTSTSQAQTDFAALFSKSRVSSTTITTTFNDLVQAIQDSAVTTTDLSTVAADEAAIQGDLGKLPIPFLPGGPQPWLDQVGAAPDAVTLANIVVSPPSPVLSPPIILQPPIIVSPFGNTSLLGALSSVGVVTSPVVVVPRPLVPTPVTPIAVGAYSQLQADEQALQKELQSLAAKSGLTIADLQNLAGDSQTINQAGFHFDSPSLNTTISELATAVAGGTSTDQAQKDFIALFNGSKVSTTTINNAFSDLTKAIQDSKVLPVDLTAVAADQAAIQADLKNLYPGKGDGTGSGSGGTGTGGTTGSGGTTGTGTTGNTGGHKKHVVKHKLHRARQLKLAKLVHARKLGRLKTR
jgi:cell division protein FtsB